MECMAKLLTPPTELCVLSVQISTHTQRALFNYFTLHIYFDIIISEPSEIPRDLFKFVLQYMWERNHRPQSPDKSHAVFNALEYLPS